MKRRTLIIVAAVLVASLAVLLFPRRHNPQWSNDALREYMQLPLYSEIGSIQYCGDGSIAIRDCGTEEEAIRISDPHSLRWGRFLLYGRVSIDQLPPPNAP